MKKIKSESSELNERRAMENGRRFSHGGDIYAFARIKGVEVEDVLDFSASINPLGMPPAARCAFRRALRQVNSYPEPYAESLTQTLAEYHGLAASQVLAGNGSTHLIYLLARALHVQRVVLIAPLFSEHASAFRANGAHVRYVTLRPPSFILDLAEVEKTMRREQPDALVLTNPNSPTGALTPREQVRALVQLCRGTQTRLLVDEAFIDWTEEGSVKQIAAQDDGVIVLRSLTKFFALPGLRVGYVLASPKVIRKLQAQIEPWAVNVVAQAVGIACVQDQHFIKHSRSFMYKERAWLSTQLSQTPGLRVFPASANFLLLQTKGKGFSASSLAEHLAQEKILIRVCDNFVGLGKRFFRVAVRTRVDNRCLLRGIQMFVVQHRALLI